jgi:hypothetical protein
VNFLVNIRSVQASPDGQFSIGANSTNYEYSATNQTRPPWNVISGSLKPTRAYEKKIKKSILLKVFCMIGVLTAATLKIS